VKVTSLAHFGFIWRSCGSEVVMHELLKAAAMAGHDATCYVTNRDARRSWTGNEPVETVDGVKYVRVRNALVGAQLMARETPDVVVTHHDHASLAIRKARAIGARSVFLTHNHFDHNSRPMRLKADLVIHNSEWVERDLERKFGPSKETMVMHPPLTPERHLVSSTGECLTLINLNRDKGAEQFYELAERMPDRQFLGVIGGHGEQVIRRNLPNVSILEHGPDTKRIWSNTRILLMPSVAESYGLTAIEAALNGIPTIAHPTPGLQENLGRQGLFADRDNLDVWEKQIVMLDEQDIYEQASDHARSRAAEALSATRASLNLWLGWLTE
jgi:glycosyltransferase involved in cell wall biosynthesis